MKIAVIIPSYNRPDLLIVALESLLSQQEYIAQVIIGDDSRPIPARDCVTAFQQRHQPIFEMQYIHNIPSLGQGANVDALIQLCSADLCLLLHDDDYLLPGAISALRAPHMQYPHITASFGDQLLITHDGVLVQEPTSINHDYYRTANREGLVNAKLAGEVQMFPNDCYLVRTESAKRVGYRQLNFGTSVDTAFGLRLGASSTEFYYVHTPVAAYRLTDGAVSQKSTGSMHHLTYLLNEYPDLTTAPPLVRRHIRYKLPVAIGIALREQDYHRALRWSLHPANRKYLLTLGGIKRLALAALGRISVRQKSI